MLIISTFFFLSTPQNSKYRLLYWYDSANQNSLVRLSSSASEFDFVVK